MRKKILIPTDFSQNAWNALNYAINLFRTESCDFYILNAYQRYHLTTDVLLDPKPGNPEFEKVKKDSETGLEKLKGEILSKSEDINHSFEFIPTYNSVLDAIVETVKTKGIDLIVMGTKGKNNSAQKIYGSTAVDVMEKVVDCASIIVPENSKFVKGAKKEIVFATNFMTFYKRRELKELTNMARIHNAAIRILHVENHNKLTAEQERNQGMLQDIVEDVEHSFHTLTDMPVVEGINSFIVSRNSHMLAIINKQHNFFYSIFLQPLVKEIGHDALVPVLVMHHKK